MTREEKHNGWTNWRTWNVALWIANDYGLYCMAREYAQANAGECDWDEFIEGSGLELAATPDGVAYADLDVNREEMAGMLEELAA